MYTLNDAVKVGIVVEGEMLKKVGKHLKKNWKAYAKGVAKGAIAVGAGAGAIKAGKYLSKKENRYKVGYAVGDFLAPFGLGAAEATGKEVGDRYIKPLRAKTQ